MSSGSPPGPPQLHLALPPNTTSFKRSFEQFGFDLESPVGGPEAGSSGSSGSSRRTENGRNSRNKRARSASSLSDGNDSLRSSASSATLHSSDTSISEDSTDGPSGISAGVSAVSPPRIPTPDIQDIEMPYYQQEDPQPQPSSGVSLPVNDQHYRISLDRLESVRRSPSLPRTPSPPPILPPLILEESTSSVPYLGSTIQPSPLIPGNLYPVRRAPDVPPRLPSPVQRSPALPEPLFISIEAPSPSSALDVTESRNEVDVISRSGRELSFTERLNAALDTGDMTSFRERVSSALEAFRNSSRAYDDLSESSSSAAGRPRSSASTLSNRRGITRSLTPLSVAIPSSSILSSSSPSPRPDPLLQDSIPSGTTASTNTPPSRRPQNPTIRDLLDFSDTLDLEATGDTSSSSMPLSSPTRLSPIRFSDPLWDSGDVDITTSSTSTSSSTGVNVSASSSTTRRPHWRQLQQTNSSQPEQRRRSLQPHRQSSFSRDLTRWFEDNSSDAEPPSSSSRHGPPRIDFGDISDGEEEERPIIPRPTLTLSDIYFYPDMTTSSTRTNPTSGSIRNAGHSALSTEDRDRDETLQARRARLIAQGLIDPRERENMNSNLRRSLTERRPRGLGPEADTARTRHWPRRAVQEPAENRRPSSDVWQFSWNDALERARERQRERERDRRDSEMRLDLESQLSVWDNMDVDRDENTPDDTDSGQEVSESERIYRQSRRLRLSGLRPPGSSLFDSADSDWRNASRAFGFTTSDLGQTSSSLSSSFNPGLRRIRSRIHGPRPGASNSLLTENAAELRRRNARAELIEQYSSHSHPTDPNLAARSGVSSALRRLNADLVRHETSRSPVLPPLPYQSRSPSPPALPQAIVEILDSVDRETQNQERLNGDETHRWSSSALLHSRPHIPQLFDTQREVERTRESNMDIVEGGGTSFQRVAEERLRRIELALHANSDSREELPRSHSHSPSWPYPTDSRSRSRQESTGFFDSQSSSISDIIRTITNNGDLDLPEYDAERQGSDDSERVPLLSSHEDRNRWTSNNDLPDQTSSFARHHRSRSNPPPSIPPPDFGDTTIFIADSFPQDDVSPRSETSAPGRRTEFSSGVPSRIPSVHHRSNSGSSNSAPDPRAPPARGTIDVESFAPGPFRTTMQRMVDQGRLRSTRQQPQIPPVIPPFTFDDDFDSLGVGLPTQRTSNFPEPRNSRPSHTHRSNPPNTQSSYDAYREARESPFNLSRRVSLPASAGRGLGPFHRTFTDDSEPSRSQSRQRPDDLHRVIRNHARMDASLLHGPDNHSHSDPMPGESEGFNHAIEVLRHDGLSETRSQQLIDRYRRERSANAPSPSSTSSLWGALEENSSSRDNNSRPWRANRNSSTSDSLVNPFSGSLVDYMRSRESRQPSPTRTSDRMQATQDRIRAGRTFLGLRNRNPVSFGDDLFSDMLLPQRRNRSGTFSLGDFVRDEDFDTSYESLSLLDARLGEVKPRGTPDHIVAGLDTAFFKDWVTEDCDKRCPICLDDYKSLDPVLKLKECSHWLHKSCLEQWLKGASTCPVCRKSVTAPPSPLPPFSFNFVSSSSSSSTQPRPLPDHVRWNFRPLRRAPRRPSESSNPDGTSSNTTTETGPSRNRAGINSNNSNNSNNNNPHIPTYANASSSSTSTSIWTGPRVARGINVSGTPAGSSNSRGHSRRRSASEANVHSTGDSAQRGSGARSGGDSNGNSRNQTEDDTSRMSWHRYMP